MSEYSPGPWRASKSDPEAFYRVDDAEGKLIAKVEAYWSNGDANTMLIAAAPEMLELLRMVVNELDTSTERMHRLAGRIEAVLARIDGKETT